MNNYFNDGDFIIGVNYWSSNAGIKTWQNFDADVIEDDFIKLKNVGVKVLRVFPLWSDFQPLTQMLGHLGLPTEIVVKDDNTTEFTNEEEQGIDIDCIHKFETVCDLAKKYDFKLIVPLITGWMSGRCFFPEAFIGKNVITDFECIEWEVRYVKYFVNRFKGDSTIIAWELGNECNCLAPTSNKSQTWVWTNTIVSAIRLCDNSRPILSGMHSLCQEKNWDIQSQSELCDVLTIHPYVLFTDYCDYEKLISPRAIVHSSAEISVYSDVGNVPCLLEEIGTLNPVIGSDKVVEKFVLANMFNSWSYNGQGFLWWTSFDQDKFCYSPYEQCDCERQLGLFKSDKTEKDVVNAYRKFNEFLQNFPYKKLPERERDAVCLISPKCWSDIFGAFMLSKRAGIELFYADKTKKIPNSQLYIVTGSSDANYFNNSKIKELMQLIKDGATVLFTYAGGLFGYFEEIVGCESFGRYKDNEICRFTVDGLECEIERDYALDIKCKTAENLISDQNGKPLLIYNKFGKGNVLFFNGPLEKYYCERCNTSKTDIGYEKVYNYVKRYVKIDTPIKKSNPNTYMTIHKLNEKRYIVVGINNTEKDITEQFILESGYKIKRVYYGDIDIKTNQANIYSANAVVFEIEKE